MAFRAARYWDLEGTFASGRPAIDAPSFPATLDDARRQAPRVGPRLRRRDRSARPPTPTSRCSTKPGAIALAARLDDRPFTVASVETRAHDRAAEGAVHHVDACSRRRAASSASARRAPCTSRRVSTSAASSPTCAPTRPRSRRRRSARRATRSARMYGDEYLPDKPREYRSKVKNAQEAHEAIRPAGDAHAHRRRRRTASSAAATSVASTTSSGSAPSRRQMADARIRRVTLRLDGDVDRRRGRDLPGDGPHDRVPRLPPRVRRGRRRPRRRARGPRGDPAAARRRRRASRAASCGRRATPRSRRRATPRRAW